METIETMTQRINKHVENTKNIQGYALACVGTKRTAYWGTMEEWVYDEKEASCFPDKNSASHVMCQGKAYCKILWPYMRLVPIANINVIYMGQLPTAFGY